MVDQDFISSLLRVQQGYGWHMHDGRHMFGSYWGDSPVLHVVFWFAVVAAIVGLTLLAVRYLGRQDSSSDVGSHALDQLDARYARGEIDREDYLQRKQDILER